MPSMSRRLNWPNQSETLSGRLLEVAHVGRQAISFGRGHDDRLGLGADRRDGWAVNNE
jgi:hypothetical protein